MTIIMSTDGKQFDTTSAARLVTLPQAVLITAPYKPESVSARLLRTRLVFVWPGRTLPSLIQQMLCGPVPLVTVLKMAMEPTNRMRFVIGNPVAGVLTVSVALLVIELVAPVMRTL